MTSKIYCPACGRCIGEFISSNETGVCRALIKEPTTIKKKQIIHKMKCIKCKEEIFVSMELKD